MSASISTLPVWKKDSSPAEWLSEISALALQYPERFQRIVVIFEECDAGLPTKTRQHSYQIPCNTDILGALEAAKLELFEYMKGRRD